jgi:hypothetical protein
MNNTTKVMSITAVIAAAAIFVLPSILANSALATQNFGSPFGANAGPLYQKFKQCLASAENNGVATVDQIGRCLNTVYHKNN